MYILIFKDPFFLFQMNLRQRASCAVPVLLLHYDRRESIFCAHTMDDLSGCCFWPVLRSLGSGDHCLHSLKVHFPRTALFVPIYSQEPTLLHQCTQPWTKQYLWLVVGNVNRAARTEKLIFPTSLFSHQTSGT